MQIVEQTSESRQTSIDDWLDQAVAASPEPTASAHKLDAPDMRRRLGQLLEWFKVERQRQAANRYQMALDEDFYDGLQWSEEDMQKLIERNQAPLVYNLVKPTVDWVLGTEKRTRVDFKVLPRNEEQTNQAEAKTKVLKYISDVNRLGFQRSRGFSDCIKVGLGWLEDGVRGDPSDLPIYSRSESWRNIIYDSFGNEMDGSDWRYLFRWKWVDLDIAVAMFPDRADRIRSASLNADRYGQQQDEEFWYLGQMFRSYDERGDMVGRRVFSSDTVTAFNRRSRVRLYEAWYRVPVVKQIIRGEQFDGQVYDQANPAMRNAVDQGYASAFDALQMEVRMAIFTEGDMLYESVSPYRHNRFPFTPLWCYRRGRDNAPYGVIRNIRDPQEDLNKRMSKAQFILASNQVIMEEGAVEDVDELASEVARPDGVIVRARGRELEIRRDNTLADQHIKLAELDAKRIQDAGGVTDEQMGRQTNAQSGRAIEARQLQGSVVISEPFDNLRMAIQLQGEIQLSLCEQYLSQPMVVRLAGSKGLIEWLRVNQPEQLPDGTVRYLNDLTEAQADFVVDEQDFHATQRQAMFEELMALAGKLPPEVSMRFLDLIIEMSDIPNKDDFVARLRKITGEVDPSQKLSPQEQQEMEATQQAAQQAQALQQRAVELDLAEKEATVEKLRAEAQKIMAEAQAAGVTDAGSGEIQGQLAEIDRVAQEEIQRAREEAAKAQAAAEAKIADIQRQYNATVEAARINATTKADTDAHAAEMELARENVRARAQREATIEAARITAESNERIAKINQASKDAVNAALDSMAKLVDPLTKQIADMKAAAEKRDVEGAAKEKAAKEAAKNTSENGTGKGQSNAAAPAAPPLNLTLNIDAKSESVKKSYQFKTDAQGNPVGIEVTPEKGEGK